MVHRSWQALARAQPPLHLHCCKPVVVDPCQGSPYFQANACNVVVALPPPGLAGPGAWIRCQKRWTPQPEVAMPTVFPRFYQSFGLALVNIRLSSPPQPRFTPIIVSPLLFCTLPSQATSPIDFFFRCLPIGFHNALNPRLALPRRLNQTKPTCCRYLHPTIQKPGLSSSLRALLLILNLPFTVLDRSNHMHMLVYLRAAFWNALVQPRTQFHTMPPRHRKWSLNTSLISPIDIMKWTAAALGLAATVAAVPQGAASGLKPDGSAPEGCTGTYNGKFEVSIFKLGASKRSIEKRDCSGDQSLVLDLKDGVLTDSKGRIGSIVANYQFQFDGPPAQAGALYTAGFSTCQNGSLAIGSSTVFYQCRSGDFYNLYDRHWAEQCEAVEIVAMPCSAQKSNGGSPMQSPIATSMAVTTIVAALSDGQPQVKTTTIPVPMCQIGDGQVQAHSTPCDQAPGAPVSQISDGQIQAPTNLPPVSQISDGQIQISDGQVQAPSATGAPVTQISDGQVQAPSATGGAKVTQISDGQVQAPTTTAATIPVAAAGKAIPGLAAAGLAAALFFGSSIWMELLFVATVFGDPNVVVELFFSVAFMAEALAWCVGINI
ncbi:covalently-linked cell wall protein [Cordyceps militaris CM01]|uniref:Covalently-linked cell wall protein n=1 Tax=Cordyceps militaris (strain CM01) TaxID=983644 RepID=G3JCG1_CORMM|nr:covalently-linked cell wall protein [Cordyceps militaris CM01]EGX94622.1 covalently-linked cell wall protein [Cordyceps militaris CM01]